ncbi:hypothetical protein [Pseudomonas gessardii]|uniref:Type III secretion protein n=1 Tax=Pseudomonas gessardii TaxID=78544 RepID=A0A7Y1MUY4_9PSED|nr:hypothetical protein [Pseudomonas gessardii]NNA98755.1 hypothetical protein [Pseudomonas gessardii]
MREIDNESKLNSNSQIDDSQEIPPPASDIDFFQASLAEAFPYTFNQPSILGTHVLSAQSAYLATLSKRATDGLRDLSLNKKSKRMQDVTKSLSDAHRELSMSIKVLNKTVQCFEKIGNLQ